MSSLTFGSLFAGIGGFDLGFERAGFTCKWQVEIDDYATRVLAKHWPDVHRERDIKTCGSNNIEPVDVIIGGFPCQDISYAGRGAGLDGERSGLFFEAVRVVCELKPRAVVLENVAALLTRGLDRVLGTLAEVGYDAEWHCIPAAAVGAPHIRDRVFVLAYTKCDGRNEWWTKRKRQQRSIASIGTSSNVADTNGSGRKRTGSAQPAERDDETKPIGRGEDVANTGRIDGHWRPSERAQADRQGVERNQAKHHIERCGQVVPDSNGKGLERQRQITSRTFEKHRDAGDQGWWATEPAVGRVANGVPRRVDRLRGLGNAVVPQVAEFVGNLVKDKLDVRIQS